MICVIPGLIHIAFLFSHHPTKKVAYEKTSPNLVIGFTNVSISIFNPVPVHPVVANPVANVYPAQGLTTLTVAGTPAGAVNIFIVPLLPHFCVTVIISPTVYPVPAFPAFIPAVAIC